MTEQTQMQMQEQGQEQLAADIVTENGITAVNGNSSEKVKAIDSTAAVNSNLIYDKKNRFALVDNLRGIVIFSWTILFCVCWFEFTPDWLGHLPADKNGLGVEDVGMVAYIFIMSLMMVYNYRRSVTSKGFLPTNRHYITRSIMMMGVGFFIGYVLNFPNGARWSTIVTYGFCTLLSLAFMPVKKPEIRLVIGVIILVTYQIVTTNVDAVYSFISGTDGEIVGSISYLGIMLICMSIGEMYFNNKKRFYISSIAVITTALIFVILNISLPSNGLIKYIYISKLHQTIGYMITSLSVVLVLFILAEKSKYLQKKPIPLISSIGQSSLFFFIIGGIFMGAALLIVGKPEVNGYIEGGTLLDMFIYIIIVQVPLLTTAWLFKKYKIRIAL